MRSSAMAWLAGTCALLGMVGTANAVDLDGRKGVGYPRAPGGPSGFAFDYAISWRNVEGVVGLAYTSYPKVGAPERDPVTNFAAGLGAHYQALRAPKATLTVGGRVNLGTGKARSGGADAGEAKDVTQLGVDVPVRVYWFPDKHISVHAEMGVSFLIGPEDGVLFGAHDGLEADGFQVRVFDGISALGLTFWW